MREKKDEDRRQKAHDKIRRAVEFDARHAHCRDFLKAWNHWRKFYFDLPAVEIKSAQQITVVENTIDYCRERDMDVNMAIACVHHAYRKRKLRPNFNEILHRGTEHWALLDDVMAELEKSEHEHNSF